MGLQGTQALYFWQLVLLEKCKKAQIPYICQLLCWKTDTIILPEVDRIRKKLWTLFQFSSGPRIFNIKTIFKFFSEFGSLQVKLFHNMFSNKVMEEYMEFEHYEIYLNKTGRQIDIAWVPVDPTPSCFCIELCLSEETYQ